MADVIGLRVLVVDDDPLQLHLARAALAALGITDVALAGDGAEALRLVGTGVDVVICDLRMPGMDGMAFMAELAQRTFAGSLILTSGESDQLLRAAGELAGAHQLDLLGVTPKPLTSATLRALLARTVPRRKPVLQHLAPVIDAEALRLALANRQLTVYYQPQVRLADGQIAGWEALSRWIDPEFGVIGPDAYIPLAEATGQIHLLTNQVLDTVLTDAPQLLGPAGATVSINLSAASLNSPEVPDRIADAVAASNIPAGRVQLEITESQLLSNPATALEVLTRLRLKGFRLSIDDFGTGYSGMRHLSMLPLAELKIDKSFVLVAPRDPAARAIVEAAVDLATKLNLETVAEGVEEAEHWGLMADLGVDIAQGYHVARPMPIESVAEWLAEWTATHPGALAPEAPTVMAVAPPVAVTIAYDPNALRAIIGDDPATHDRFVGSFLQQAGRMRTELAEAVAQGDSGRIDDLGHQLKSTARSVGALALGDVCEEIEVAGKTGRLADVDGLTGRFEVELDRFTGAFEESR